MVWLGAQALRQVKIIDKNNFIEYIEPRFKNRVYFLSERSGPPLGAADFFIGRVLRAAEIKWDWLVRNLMKGRWERQLAKLTVEPAKMTTAPSGLGPGSS